jgi:Helix-turn-helix domain/RodZ C-terminal domain
VFEIGNSLREARYRQQLELSDVELATKIRARYLQALEEESFEALPAQTYVKGFLRTYADYLGLDGQLYVDEYNSRYATGEDEPREPVVARRSSTVHQRHRRLERRGVLLALGGIAIVCAFFIAAFKFSSNDNNPPIPNLGTTTTNTTRPPATGQKKQRKAAVVRKVRFFVVATTGNCWMDVRNYSSSGKTLFTGTVQQGQSHRFVARRLWINFGNPGNVKAAVNGRPVAIPGGGRSVMVLVSPSGVSVAPATA